MKTACIDSRATAGGTCLNIGCIPSKALLQSSEKFAEARNGLAEHGVKIGDISLDLRAMMARKDKVVETLTRGVEFLFRKNKVDWLKGRARIAAPGRLSIGTGNGAAQEIDATHIVIATGSESTPPPGRAAGWRRNVSSTVPRPLPHGPERPPRAGGRD